MSRSPVRGALLGALVTLAACGRVGFDASAFTDGPLADDDGSTLDGDAAMVVPIVAAGVYSDASSELRRTLGTTTSTRTFTFATWYRSNNLGAMLMNAGTTGQRHSMIWASQNNARVGFQHQVDSTSWAAFPVGWDYLDIWVHLVISVDLTDADPAQRVRWWWDGAPQPVTNGGLLEFPQDLDLNFGAAGVVHTLGNKWEGSFDWTGSLAETYVIWGYALDPGAFIRVTAQGARSIAYTGPITTESVYFDYVEPGKNRFAGQPDWTATSVTSTTTDLPY